MITPEQLQILTEEIYNTLRQHQGISEYDLLQAVTPNTLLNTLNESGNVGLFQRHFVLKHGLYHLQKQLQIHDKEVVVIGLLKIYLCASGEASGQEVAEAENTSLAEFYLNWENLNTSEEEVNELLNRFWRDYLQYLQQDEAWALLGLQVGASSKQITERYRELAAIHHPDKGGEAETFIKIRAAYEAVRRSTK